LPLPGLYTYAGLPIGFSLPIGTPAFTVDQGVQYWSGSIWSPVPPNFTGGALSGITLTSNDGSLTITGSPGTALNATVATAFYGSKLLIPGVWASVPALQAAYPAAANPNLIAMVNNQGPYASINGNWQALWNPTASTLGISTATFQNATTGVSFSVPLTATNNVGTVTWAVVSYFGAVTAPAISGTNLTIANPIGVTAVEVQATDTGNSAVTQKMLIIAAASSGTAAATPTFSPAAGSFTSAQSVAISSTTPAATIYYTTNGAPPDTSSSVYTGPITVSVSQTVQAIATASGFAQSAIGSATYTIGNYLGVNINQLLNYSSEQSLLDLVQMSSSNNSNFTAWSVSGSTTLMQLYAVLDANGFPTSLPGGNSVQIAMNFSLNNQDSSGYGNGLPPGAVTLYPGGIGPLGEYTLQFSGNFVGAFSGDVVSGSLATSTSGVTVTALGITSTLANNVTGTVTFQVTNPSTSGMRFTLTSLPASGSGNYLNSLHVIRTSQYTAWQDGTNFDPHFIAELTNNGDGGYSLLRFMQALLMTSAPNGACQLYQYQLPGLTSASSLTQTMSANFNGPSGTYNCVLGYGGNGSADIAQTNTVTLTYGSPTAVFGSAFTHNVSSTGTNLWIPLFANWAARNQPTFMSQASGNGNGTPPMIPYETCIALSNAANADCWLNIPIWVNAFTGQTAFWTSLATLVKNNLNEGLKCYIEFANEVPIETDFGYAQTISQAVLGGPHFDQWIGLTLQGISAAFSAVFGSAFASTILIGPATQFALGNGQAFLENMMNAPVWVAMGNPAPYFSFNCWYIAPYFGGPSNATDLTTMLGVTKPLDDFFACMYGNVGTSANGSHTYSSVPTSGWIGGAISTATTIFSGISSQPWANYAVHAYEAGAGFPATNFTNNAGSYTGPYGAGAYTTLQKAASAFFGAAHRDVRMGYCYNDPTHQLSTNPGYLPAMITAGFASLTHFNSCQDMNQAGAWGALENVMQLPAAGGTGSIATNAPTYGALMSYIG
jgi:hypothetical protein